MTWKQGKLKEPPRGDSAKPVLAACLRRETTLTVRQIAGHPHTGSWKGLNDRLCPHNKLAHYAAYKVESYSLTPL